MSEKNNPPGRLPSEGSMSLVEHLGELRFRLTRAAYGIFLGMCACWAFSEHLFNFVRKPIEPYLPSGGLVFTAPIDKFMAHIKVAFIAGMFISAPIWLYQLWKFISPALKSGVRVRFFRNASVCFRFSFQLFRCFADGF
jgi:sec-independent protein translocase protein TatC